MKNLFLMVFILGLINCENSSPKITDDEIKEATSFFMDSIVNHAKHGEKYIIIPRYNADLIEKDFANLLDDSILTLENINFMKTQYGKTKQRKIEDFVDEKYYSKFTSNEPLNGQVCYKMDPPLFTVNKSHFIIYSKTFFWLKEEIKYDDLFFLFKRNGRGWELEGFIKRQK